MKELVRVRALTGLESFLMQRGADPPSLYSRLGLSRRTLSDPDGWIPFQSVLRAFEMAGRELGDPAFGHNLSRSRDLSFLGPVFLAARHSPDVRTALECLSRFFAIQNTGVSFALAVADDRAIRSYHVSPRLRPIADQWVEETITTFPVLLEALSGARPRILRVLLRHAPNRPVEDYSVQFGADVRFEEAMDAIEFEPSILGRPLPNHDADLHRFMKSYLESRVAESGTDTEAVTRMLLETLIPSGQCRIEAVCEQLGMHPRALQRRLKERGVRFCDLLDERRKSIAERLLLKGDLSLGEISAHLGYSEQSAFNHAFRRWRGCSPAAWLERQRKDP